MTGIEKGIKRLGKEVEREGTGRHAEQALFLGIWISLPEEAKALTRSIKFMVHTGMTKLY